MAQSANGGGGGKGIGVLVIILILIGGWYVSRTQGWFGFGGNKNGPTDPPVVVHDGSMHIRIRAGNPPNPVNGVVSGDVDDLTLVRYTSNYQLTSGALPDSIPNTWELDVCDSAPCGPTTSNGIAIKSAPSSGNKGTVNITLLDPANYQYGSPQSNGQNQYETEVTKTTPIYADYFTFTPQGGSSAQFTCDHSGDNGDRHKCMLGIGKGKLTQ